MDILLSEESGGAARPRKKDEETSNFIDRRGTSEFGLEGPRFTLHSVSSCLSDVLVRSCVFARSRSSAYETAARLCERTNLVITSMYIAGPMTEYGIKDGSRG